MEDSPSFSFVRKQPAHGVILPSFIPEADAPDAAAPPSAWAERWRVHAAWGELAASPALSESQRKAILERVEADRIAFRSLELDAAQSRRLELAEELAARREAALGARMEGRLQRRWEDCSARVLLGCSAVQRHRKRRIRKMRLGPRRSEEEPASWSQAIAVRSRRARPRFTLGLPTSGNRIQECWNSLFDKREHSPELCEYWTKWTEENLYALHQLFKAMRLKSAEAARSFEPMQRLRVRGWDSGLSASLQHLSSQTARRLFSTVPEEAAAQAAVFLQSVLRGRAAQTHLFQGRTRFQDVIEEVRDLPAPRPPTPALVARREPQAPEVLSRAEGLTSDDLLEAIAQEIMRLRVSGPSLDQDQVGPHHSVTKDGL